MIDSMKLCRTWPDDTSDAARKLRVRLAPCRMKLPKETKARQAVKFDF
jgi:hypothetical protein